MEADEWIAEFAKAIDEQPPTPAEFEAILELAAEAAHGSQRIAAPVACWIAGRNGRPLGELIEAAEGVSART